MTATGPLGFVVVGTVTVSSGVRGEKPGLGRRTAAPNRLCPL
jgi:hypothetical protein